MDKNSREYKKLKKEMDDYLKNKEIEREKQRINSLGFSRDTYPSEGYQKLLRKRTGIKSPKKSYLYILISLLLCLALLIFLLMK
jgi:hypothetical protein